MTTWDFTLRVAEAATEEQITAVACEAEIDVTMGGAASHALCSLEAGNALSAVIQAVAILHRHGLTATGVDCDDAVTLGDVARRLNHSAEAVRLWAEGRRGPGGFPQPLVSTGRLSVYSWSEVAQWLPAVGLSADVDIDFALADQALALKARAGCRVAQIEQLLHA